MQGMLELGEEALFLDALPLVAEPLDTLGRVIAPHALAAMQPPGPHPRDVYQAITRPPFQHRVMVR